MRVTERPMQWPPTVRLFTGIVLLWEIAFLALDHRYVGRHTVWTGASTAFGLATLAALVIWRKPWAWWLFLLGPVLYWASPAWGAHIRWYWAVAELAIAALLLSPSMRWYVFGRSRPTWPVRPNRAWKVSLALSAALTVLVAVPEQRHPIQHSVSSRVEGWVFFWLVLAAAMRLVAFAIRSARRFGKPRGGTPPATGSSS